MSNVVVISNFHEDVEISRSNMAYKYFISRDFETVALYSTFSHSLKKFRLFDNPNFIALQTIAYSSSLSLRRIFSYLIFAFKVFLYLRRNKADVVYVNLPPNILTLAVFLGCTRDTRIIVDIIDLWPESFPHNGIMIVKLGLKIASFLLSPIRKYAIQKSDYCIAESSLFFESLKLVNKKKSTVIHLKKIKISKPMLNKVDEILSIIYLGNIGNIYDFESLLQIIKGLEKIRPVKLHIIGLGPKRSWLLDKLNLLDIMYVDHGASFDEQLKEEVLSTCWFGFNGFKKEAKVGLSYKSIDYLSYGVPLLNSLGADTFELIANNEGIGFNFSGDSLDSLIEKLSLLSAVEILTMKRASYSLFNSKFSGESYFSDMDKVMLAI
jgi:hypothetical protein